MRIKLLFLLTILSSYCCSTPSFLGVNDVKSAIEQNTSAYITNMLNNYADADVDQIIIVDGQRFSLLMYAAYCGKLDICQLLILRGANVNLTEEGKSALYYSIFEGHLDIAKLLINNRANLQHRLSDSDSIQYNILKNQLFK